MTVRARGQLGIGNVLRQILAVVEEPLHALFECGQFVEHAVLENFHGDDRQYSDHRARAKWNALPVEAELVVVEAVLLVPQAGATKAVHRVDDLYEMLEKLGGYVLVRRVAIGELERHRQHGRRIEGHPGGTVRLLQVTTSRQRLGAVEYADVVETQKASGE